MKSLLKQVLKLSFFFLFLQSGTSYADLLKQDYGCKHEGLARSPACTKAIQVSCNIQKHSGGVAQQIGPNVIAFSCLDGELIPMTYTDLPGCDSKLTQGAGCMAAAHRACNTRGYGAGIIQDANGIDPIVLCFQPEQYLEIGLNELTRIHSGCNSIHGSQTIECAAAIDQACERRGSSGGIAQEVGSETFAVACFREALPMRQTVYNKCDWGC